jgi:hypothetical protein
MRLTDLRFEATSFGTRLAGNGNAASGKGEPIMAETALRP